SETGPVGTPGASGTVVTDTVPGGAVVAEEAARSTGVVVGAMLVCDWQAPATTPMATIPTSHVLIR
ncbi:MAG: hypothetical protein OEO77_05740, partial [Acidimicrobiia bacterium]|nr:hypothetical protein [Acidimicrobiia bacterium]